jgi:hypothetical protein
VLDGIGSNAQGQLFMAIGCSVQRVGLDVRMMHPAKFVAPSHRTLGSTPDSMDADAVAMADPADPRDREYVPYPYLRWFEASRRVQHIAKEASMNQGRRKSVFIGVATIALACATGSVGVCAAPVLFVTTDFSTNDGQFTSPQTTSTATTKTSTSSLDGANFATAAADAANGSVGIGMATNLAGAIGVSASAGAQITDVWVPCPTTVLCGTILDLAPVVYNMHFAGTLSPAWLAANAISGDHIEFGGSFHVAGAGDSLEFAWNGTQLAGTFCNGGPINATCAPFAFASTTLADGSLAFDDNVSFTGAVSGPGFTTLLALSADWDTTHQPSSLAFLHTFSFDIVSVDPHLGWVSDAGQVSKASVSAVPEPETLPLLSLGLLFFAPLARNRRRRR